MTDDTTVCITGGTGSFGSAFARMLLASTTHKVRIISRDEHKQEAMMRLLPSGPRLTYILADVRDVVALRQAFDGAWAVVHAAALKTVPAGQQNADEFSKVNIDGSRNVITAVLDAGVKRSLLISSDKACQAINCYGKTKAVAEELFVHANKKGVSSGCSFAVVRGGNVWASAGSVATVWRSHSADRPIEAYGKEVTRFHLEMPKWVEFAYRALTLMWGGEIFIPLVPAWNLYDLAISFGVPSGWRAVDPRPGDKPHETLVSDDEASRTVTTDWAHIIEAPEALRQVWPYVPWSGERMAGAYVSNQVRLMDMGELRALWTM